MVQYKTTHAYYSIKPCIGFACLIILSPSFYPSITFELHSSLETLDVLQSPSVHIHFSTCLRILLSSHDLLVDLSLQTMTLRLIFQSSTFTSLLSTSFLGLHSMPYFHSRKQLVRQVQQQVKSGTNSSYNSTTQRYPRW